MLSSATLACLGMGTASAGKFEPLRGIYPGVALENGGTSGEIASFNQDAERRYAVYTTLLNFADGFPAAWVDMGLQNGVPFVVE